MAVNRIATRLHRLQFALQVHGVNMAIRTFLSMRVRPNPQPRAGLHSAKHATGEADEIRCDLHPRFSRDGTALSFDSIHQGHRHVNCMELETILAYALA